MTEGAAAVIPEVLAGQILSIARRGSGGPGHTVLTASRDDCLARDRLVVLLQPILADGHDSGSENDGGVGGDENDHGSQRSSELNSSAGLADHGVRRRRQRRQAKAGDLVTAGADERPRHALVLPCVPGQVRFKCATPVTAILVVFMRDFGRTVLSGSVCREIHLTQPTTPIGWLSHPTCDTSSPSRPKLKIVQNNGSQGM